MAYVRWWQIGGQSASWVGASHCTRSWHVQSDAGLFVATAVVIVCVPTGVEDSFSVDRHHVGRFDRSYKDADVVGDLLIFLFTLGGVHRPCVLVQYGASIACCQDNITWSRTSTSCPVFERRCSLVFGRLVYMVPKNVGYRYRENRHAALGHTSSASIGFSRRIISWLRACRGATSIIPTQFAGWNLCVRSAPRFSGFGC